MASDYDEKILESIDKTFKTAEEIAEETGISKQRVNARLSSLRTYREVIWIQELRGPAKGKRPKKYRKSPRL